MQVRIQVTAPDRRVYVAVDDPLPAGLEALDPALATTARGSLSRDDFWGPWNHQELRDDRALAFADSLPGGVYLFRYSARATTRGRFLAGPARAEEMYAPETWGRSPAEVLLVE